MPETRNLHRGHAALLELIEVGGNECTATLRNGTVGFDHHSQDFLVGWYEDLKSWRLIDAEDLVGRVGKLGETVSLTSDGIATLERIREA